MTDTTAGRAILIAAADMPAYDELPETLAERQALPPRFHIPVYDDTMQPRSWLCAVCWDESECSAWPCATAASSGTQVFAAADYPERHAAPAVRIAAGPGDRNHAAQVAQDLDNALTGHGSIEVDQDLGLVGDGVIGLLERARDALDAATGVVRQ